jgi:hypothetical protein
MLKLSRPILLALLLLALTATSLRAQTHERLQEAYEQKGMFQEAIADLEKVNPDQGARLREAYSKAGTQGYWQARIDFDKESKQSYVSPYFTAVKYAALGDKDRPFSGWKRPTRSATPGSSISRSTPRSTACAWTPDT